MEEVEAKAFRLLLPVAIVGSAEEAEKTELTKAQFVRLQEVRSYQVHNFLNPAQMYIILGFILSSNEVIKASWIRAGS